MSSINCRCCLSARLPDLYRHLKLSSLEVLTLEFELESCYLRSSSSKELPVPWKSSLKSEISTNFHSSMCSINLLSMSVRMTVKQIWYPAPPSLLPVARASVLAFPCPPRPRMVSSSCLADGHWLPSVVAISRLMLTVPIRKVPGLCFYCWIHLGCSAFCGTALGRLL